MPCSSPTLLWKRPLKAHVCRVTGDLAPRIHNLVRLAEIARLELAETDLDLLAEVNEFNIEGRYPEMLLPPPTQGEAEEYIRRIARMLQWLNNQF